MATSGPAHSPRLTDLVKRLNRRNRPGIADLNDLKERLGIARKNADFRTDPVRLGYRGAVATLLANTAFSLKRDVETIDPLDGLANIGKVESLIYIIEDQEGRPAVEKILSELGVDLEHLQRRVEERLVQETTDLVAASLEG